VITQFVAVITKFIFSAPASCFGAIALSERVTWPKKGLFIIGNDG
jgi:hypothetical protein